MVVDPWGQIVAQMSDTEGVFIADIDLDYVNEVRENMDCLSHFKKELLANRR